MTQPVRLTLFDAEDAHRIVQDYAGTIDRGSLVGLLEEFQDKDNKESPESVAQQILEMMTLASPVNAMRVQEFVTRIAEIYNRARVRERNGFEDAHHTRIEK